MIPCAALATWPAADTISIESSRYGRHGSRSVLVYCDQFANCIDTSVYLWIHKVFEDEADLDNSRPPVWTACVGVFCACSEAGFGFRRPPLLRRFGPGGMKTSEGGQQWARHNAADNCATPSRRRQGYRVGRNEAGTPAAPAMSAGDSPAKTLRPSHELERISVRNNPNGVVGSVPDFCARGCGFDLHYWKNIV
ncbi:unnamed protein product, partial [Iphiclides podalirius]